MIQNLTKKILPTFAKNPKDSATVIHYYKPLSMHPIITERNLNNTIRFTTKHLNNGRTLEVFEAGNNIYKVLKDLQGNPIAVNSLSAKGKKTKFRLFADFAYSNITIRFKQATQGFIDIK